MVICEMVENVYLDLIYKHRDSSAAQGECEITHRSCSINNSKFHVQRNFAFGLTESTRPRGIQNASCPQTPVGRKISSAGYIDDSTRTKQHDFKRARIIQSAA